MGVTSPIVGQIVVGHPYITVHVIGHFMHQNPRRVLIVTVYI